MHCSFQEICYFIVSVVLVVFQFDPGKYPGKMEGLFRHPVSVDFLCIEFN